MQANIVDVRASTESIEKGLPVGLGLCSPSAARLPSTETLRAEAVDSPIASPGDVSAARSAKHAMVVSLDAASEETAVAGREGASDVVCAHGEQQQPSPGLAAERSSGGRVVPEVSTPSRHAEGEPKAKASAPVGSLIQKFNSQLKVDSSAAKIMPSSSSATPTQQAIATSAAERAMDAAARAGKAAATAASRAAARQISPGVSSGIQRSERPRNDGDAHGNGSRSRPSSATNVSGRSQQQHRQPQRQIAGAHERGLSAGASSSFDAEEEDPAQVDGVGMVWWSPLSHAPPLRPRCSRSRCRC